MQDIEHILLGYSLNLLLIGAVALGVLATIALKLRHLTEKKKELLFFGIIGATIVPTMFLIFSTVYINNISSSSGPIHWHADYEVFACGKEVDLIDPKGFSNKIGTPTLHEHNDKRIHVEGVVIKPEDVSLGNFFHVVGGKLTSTSFSLPTNNGVVSYQNGDDCPDGTKGELQVFVYKTHKDGYFSQQKLTDPSAYVLSPESAVPPADCIVVDFGPTIERTDKLCRSYQVGEKINKLKGEE